MRTRRISGGSAVRCIRWFAGVSYEKDGAKRRIANMIGEWIPVTQRLPEEEQDVVVFTNEGTHVAALDEDGVWCPSHGDGWMFPGVTHWMPLPAPPTDAK